jgi:hypothetical protein
MPKPQDTPPDQNLVFAEKAQDIARQTSQLPDTAAAQVAANDLWCQFLDGLYHAAAADDLTPQPITADPTPFGHLTPDQQLARLYENLHLPPALAHYLASVPPGEALPTPEFQAIETALDSYHHLTDHPLYTCMLLRDPHTEQFYARAIENR